MDESRSTSRLSSPNDSCSATTAPAGPAANATAFRERSHAPSAPPEPRAGNTVARASNIVRAAEEAPRFEASSSRGTAVPLDREALLRTRIKDLALRVAGTRVERMIDQLNRELAAANIGLRPPCYLSDEWGCPDGKPIIGIPFYLADEKLGAIEGEVSEVREDERESMQYLRHEAGHAFCYAYELYDREDFNALFGSFTRPYLEDYKVRPFSRSYVRHIAGWYAQKHPDEDFAETFAVYITPGLNWQQAYAGWPALRKLEYVDARIREFGQTPPRVRPRGPELPDVPVESMEETVAELFERGGPPADVSRQLGTLFDGDLRQVFDAPGTGPSRACDFLEGARKAIITSVAHWTGLARPAVKAVVLHLIGRSRLLELTVRNGAEAETLARFTVLVTALAMNRVYSGRFCEP